MWKRFVQLLRCPLCKAPLDLSTLASSSVDLTNEQLSLARERGLLNAEFSIAVDEGLLLCRTCRTWFPVSRGLPVLLPYATPVHERFTRDFYSQMESMAAGYACPSKQPPRGEQLVMQSFSTEWETYDFDGIIWQLHYTDHELRFLRELGQMPELWPGPFMELGCGIGITTFLAHKNFSCDAVGVDLSLAAMRAATYYRSNPFLHFVQASVFALPFGPGTFETIYTRGVLHHTHSTHKAFQSLAQYCKPGGLLYVWVYGPRSINDNSFRRVAYGTEVILRWILNRCPRWVGSVVFAPIAAAYLAFNAVKRSKNRSIQKYNYRRALHAARDRFTPEYAWRQDAQEVSTWFCEEGFEAVEVVDWRIMPRADQDDFRRNTGVRGRHVPANARSGNTDNLT